MPEIDTLPEQIVAFREGAAETDRTVTEFDTRLTHFPVSVWVAVRTSPALKLVTFIVQVDPFHTAEPD